MIYSPSPTLGRCASCCIGFRSRYHCAHEVRTRARGPIKPERYTRLQSLPEILTQPIDGGRSRSAPLRLPAERRLPRDHVRRREKGKKRKDDSLQRAVGSAWLSWNQQKSRRRRLVLAPWNQPLQQPSPKLSMNPICSKPHHRNHIPKEGTDVNGVKTAMQAIQHQNSARCLCTFLCSPSPGSRTCMLFFFNHHLPVPSQSQNKNDSPSRSPPRCLCINSNLSPSNHENLLAPMGPTDSNSFLSYS